MTFFKNSLYLSIILCGALLHSLTHAISPPSINNEIARHELTLDRNHSDKMLKTLHKEGHPITPEFGMMLVQTANELYQTQWGKRNAVRILDGIMLNYEWISEGTIAPEEVNPEVFHLQSHALRHLEINTPHELSELLDFFSIRPSREKQQSISQTPFKQFNHEAKILSRMIRLHINKFKFLLMNFAKSPTPKKFLHLHIILKSLEFNDDLYTRFLVSTTENLSDEQLSGYGYYAVKLTTILQTKIDKFQFDIERASHAHFYDQSYQLLAKMQYLTPNSAHQSKISHFLNTNKEISEVGVKSCAERVKKLLL